MSATPNLWAVVQRMIDTALAVRCPYGIDDVYVTFSNTEPTARWPGTSWERITDCFLLAADSTHPAGCTGGAWEVVQTVEQMPAHGSSAPHNAPLDPCAFLHRLPADSRQGYKLRQQMVLPELPLCKDRCQQMAGVQHIVCELHPPERLRLCFLRASHKLFKILPQPSSHVCLPERRTPGKPLRLRPGPLLDGGMDQLQFRSVPRLAGLRRRLVSILRTPVSDCHPARLAAETFEEAV